MDALTPYRPLFLAGCFALFLYLSLTLTASGAAMFADTDPFWHLAVGDLIRETGKIPQTDPWSFTAGNYRWLNISWGWDTLASYLYEQLGWQGPVALNAVTVAATLTLIFATSLLRSGSAIASLLAVVGAITMLSLHLRPLQITNLMTAVWLLILSQILRGQLRASWLVLLPLSMLLWVNMHGGFLVGFVLLGAFFLQAIYDKKLPLAKLIFLTGIAAIIAMFCNPYGIGIIEAARRPLATVANSFIIEWQPFTPTRENFVAYLYAFLFIALVPLRKLPILPAERFLAYGWLLLCFLSRRHMVIFAVVSAPLFACALARLLQRAPSLPTPIKSALIACYNRESVAKILAILCIISTIWLFTPHAAKFFQPQIPGPGLEEEIAYLEKHESQARLLNHFNLGSAILYQTRGKIPVFVDPRTETAFPREVFADYVAFEEGLPGWEGIFDKYAITAVMLPNEDEKLDALRARFAALKGWKSAFRGPQATIYLREE